LAVLVALAAARVSVGAEAAPLHPAPFAAQRAQCAGKDGWSDPAPPVRIFDDTYDVGTCGITVVLVVGDRGAVVIDSGPVAAAPLVAANIERLGLRLRDVKLILSTHEHGDHAGGLAELRRRTGATMVARAAERASIESGIMAKDDPQRDGDKPDHPGVPVDRVLREGEVVRLGALQLTPHATPGHAPGGTSWTWRSCEGTVCRSIAFADSLSAVSTDGYRFSDHPNRLAALRASFRTVAALPCDIVVTPHPVASDLYARLDGKAALVDPRGCARLAADSAAKLDERLRTEAKR
jgi:metallo-beta-lactamase class B